MRKARKNVPIAAAVKVEVAETLSGLDEEFGGMEVEVVPTPFRRGRKRPDARPIEHAYSGEVGHRFLLKVATCSG